MVPKSSTRAGTEQEEGTLSDSVFVGDAQRKLWDVSDEIVQAYVDEKVKV